MMGQLMHECPTSQPACRMSLTCCANSPCPGSWKFPPNHCMLCHPIFLDPLSAALPPFASLVENCWQQLSTASLFSRWPWQHWTTPRSSAESPPSFAICRQGLPGVQSARTRAGGVWMEPARDAPPRVGAAGTLGRQEGRRGGPPQRRAVLRHLRRQGGRVVLPATEQGRGHPARCDILSARSGLGSAAQAHRLLTLVKGFMGTTNCLKGSPCRFPPCSQRE